MMTTSTSNAPPASPVTEAPSQPVHSQRETTSIDDHTLPKSVVVRLAKSVLPENTMIQKEAVTALVKSATVFVNYLAATANDVTQQRGKKTINNEEVLSALEIAELDMMIPQLKRHIEREFEVARREKRKKADLDEDERKKRKLEEGGADEVAVEANGDEGDTEIEKATEDGDSVDERDDPEEDQDEEEGGEELDADEQEGEGDSVAVDMEENDEESEGEETDEALADDSD